MKTFNPETFQGSLRKKRYFEGWYYKTVSEHEVFAVIPGISLGDDPHAFIQLIDGKSHATNYLRFPTSEFRCKPGTFDISIGKNRFRRDSIQLNENRDSIKLHGELKFSGLTPYPSKRYSPGIMGPFSFIPNMECNHGVVSMDHKVTGQLTWNEKEFIVDNGSGYIEKDWGRSMPSSWIWMQSNVFEKQGTCFMLSIAEIPMLGKSFIGHLGFLYHDNTLFPFSTFNHSKYKIAENKPNEISVILKNSRNRLEAVVTTKGEGGKLEAPVNGSMKRSIREKTDAVISVSLYDSKAQRIFQGKGSFSGFEITGNFASLLRGNFKD